MKRSFPSAIIYTFFKITKEFCHLIGVSPLEITPNSTLLCFSILNTVGIVGGNYFLFKIYDKFEFERKLQILCFMFFNLTFIISKLPSYYPALTDHSAIFIAIMMFYAYLFSKNYFLLTLFFIGYFTFPTLFVVGGIFFIFPYKKESNQIKIDKKHLLTIAVLGFGILVSLLVFNAYPLIIALLNKSALGASEMPVNYPFFMLSVGFVILYLTAVMAVFKPLDIFEKIIEKIDIMKLLLVFSILVAFSQAIKYYFITEGFPPIAFFNNLITQSIKEPSISFFSHLFTFGIPFILPFIYYKYWGKIAEKIGLGAVLVLIFHSILMIGSESRQFLAIFPILIVLSGLLLKDHFVVDNKTIIIMGGFSFLLSTIWLPINQIIPYKRLDDIGMPYLYAIHQSPWMPSEFYYTLLLPVSLIMIITLKFTLKLKKEI